MERIRLQCLLPQKADRAMRNGMDELPIPWNRITQGEYVGAAILSFDRLPDLEKVRYLESISHKRGSCNGTNTNQNMGSDGAGA